MDGYSEIFLDVWKQVTKVFKLHAFILTQIYQEFMN